jgi:large subunit ribosomal protein L19
MILSKRKLKGRNILFIIFYRYVYPDFLPNPIPFLRDRILEKLERKDMFRRRQQIDIPEFYVGQFR